MNPGPLIETTGWTLIHSIWQGLLVALFLAVGLRILKSASARYLAAVLAMTVLIGSAITTFVVLLPDYPSRSAELRQGPITVGAETAPVPVNVSLRSIPFQKPRAPVSGPRASFDPADPVPPGLRSRGPGWFPGKTGLCPSGFAESPFLVRGFF